VVVVVEIVVALVLVVGLVVGKNLAAVLEQELVWELVPEQMGPKLQSYLMRLVLLGLQNSIGFCFLAPQENLRMMPSHHRQHYYSQVRLSFLQQGQELEKTLSFFAFVFSIFSLFSSSFFVALQNRSSMTRFLSFLLRLCWTF